MKHRLLIFVQAIIFGVAAGLLATLAGLPEFFVGMAVGMVPIVTVWWQSEKD